MGRRRRYAVSQVCKVEHQSDKNNRSGNLPHLASKGLCGRKNSRVKIQLKFLSSTGLYRNAKRSKALGGSISCLYSFEGAKWSVASATRFPCLPRRPFDGQSNRNESKLKLNFKWSVKIHEETSQRQKLTCQNVTDDNEKSHMIFRASREFLENWILNKLF